VYELQGEIVNVWTLLSRASLLPASGFLKIGKGFIYLFDVPVVEFLELNMIISERGWRKHEKARHTSSNSMERFSYLPRFKLAEWCFRI